MTEIIKAKLKEIEKNFNIKILYACESGSRAWGFASPDSDFDIRFIYIHDLNWYLSIDEKKETIDLPIDDQLLDIGGWELRKTLLLIAKSNATVFEWLQSPIRYVDDYVFRTEILNLSKSYFSPKTLIHHYLGICKNAFQSANIDGQIRIKKYFYILRPLLAAIWVKEKNEIPPMEFQKLMKIIEAQSSISNRILELLEEKKNSEESAVVDLIDEIQIFIEKEIEACKEYSDSLGKSNTENKLLDEYFFKILGV